jgi:6-phosphogluconolactonase
MPSTPTIKILPSPSDLFHAAAEEFNTYRITFTFPVLNHAAQVMFLASGPDKADMVDRVLEGKYSPPYPSQQVQPIDGTLLWMLDEPASKQLSSKVL